MRFNAYFQERDKRQAAYERLCVRGSTLLFIYDRTKDPAVFCELRSNVRALDAAYLRWCEMDRVEVEL